MGRKKKSTKKSVNVSRVKGHAQLGISLSNTSNVGSFVIDRVEFDASVGTTIGQLSQIFARWRLVRLKLKFVSNRSSTDVGRFGMAVLEDVESVTPATNAIALGMRVTTEDHIWKSSMLSFKPLKEGWLFTRDTGSLEDRLQMPCDLLFFSEGCNTSASPGIVLFQYEIEFCEIANSSVLPQQVQLKKKEDAPTLPLGDSGKSSTNFLGKTGKHE